MVKNIAKINWLLALIVGLCLMSTATSTQAQGDMEPYQAVCNFINSAKMGSGMAWNYISSKAQTNFIDRAIQYLYTNNPDAARRFNPTQLKTYVRSQLSNPYSQFSMGFWKGFSQSVNWNEQGILDNPVVTMNDDNHATVKTRNSTHYTIYHLVKEGGAWKVDTNQ